MAAQLCITALFAVYLYVSPSTYFGTAALSVLIPFAGQTVNFGFLYVPFIIFVIIGSVNGSNFTDGLDGLNTGVTCAITVFLALAAFYAGSPLFTAAGAMAGSLLGFLIFSSHPAKVIMGDTGSLALGGFVASVAIILKVPLFLAIVGLIYVIQSLSVMIQVGYYKLTHGKRVFKMAPIHHHFELSGYTETKITSVFHIISIIMCLVGLLGLRAPA
jgi:phospho-N-acetylmuramoyl-pentapeptide-transferase